MRTTDAKKRVSRRSHLNLIYFVDSARTHTIKIPFGRLSVLLGLFAVGVVWSVASVFIIIGLYDHKEDLTARLEASLATIFEYESKHDNVYETAYPANDKRPKPETNVAAETNHTTRASKLGGLALAAKDAPKSAAKTPAAAPPEVTGKADVQANANAAAKAAALAKLAAASPETPAASVATAAPNTKDQSTAAKDPKQAPTDASRAATDKAKAATSVAANAAASDTASVQNIAVSNPVLEARTSELELRFDVTNKLAGALAEGFLWAVAEFKTDTGETVFIGAPQSIEVGPKGDPKFPERSSLFAIRHFKKKMLSFPFINGKSGTFVGVKIGMMDKTGTDKMTYNVPVEIRIQAKNASEAPVASGAGAKQG